MKICPGCGCGFQDTAKFCTQCGTALPESVFAMRVTADGIEEIPNPQTEITELPDHAETPEEVSVPAEPAQDSSPAEPVSVPVDKTAPAAVPGPIVPVSIPNGRGPSPAPVKRRRSPLRLILSIAAVLILAASVVWGFSLLSRLFPRGGRTVKNALTVIAGDNDELKGYSSSGKIIRYKTEEGVRESLLSPDGSRCLFLTTEKRLMMFDGSRFTEIAEDVKTFVFSFDSSAAAYLTSENDLYLYRRNRSQRIASDVTENFCLSPDGHYALLSASGGKEHRSLNLYRFYLMDLETMEVRPVAAPDGLAGPALSFSSAFSQDYPPCMEWNDDGTLLIMDADSHGVQAWHLEIR